MKIFSSEFGHNYQTYTFGFANYCLKEKDDKLSEIYEKGYLPYSGSPEIKNVFYMARSARVPLPDLSFSSENRRVWRKFEGKFARDIVPFSKFDAADSQFLSFCVEYFAKRHGPEIMPLNRLKIILNSQLITDIITYRNRKTSEVVAYVFEVADEEMTHFWYSFYDLSMVYQSFGMWLLLDSALMAKEVKKKNFYIGTVYGERALYKTAFKNIEYWDGGKWTADVKKLRRLGHADGEKIINFIDEWKNEFKTF